MTDEKLEFRVNEDWAKFERECSWTAFVPEFAKDSKGQEYMRKKGGSAVYKLLKGSTDDNQKYACNACGTAIIGVTVAHPIWDGPFPMSGSGQCHYEKVPYCPKCEKEPDFHGTPIEVPFKEVPFEL